jgi:Kef-type K+ transport system membrane component KefB
MPLEKLAAAFFLQMAIILFLCRIAGWIGRRFGQPQVVCEMVAGVFLGPSLLGWLAPGLQAQLFPPESLRMLYVGAQLGVGLYMFLVGAEFRVDLFQGRLRSAAAVSIAGMVVPFLLGAALTPWLMKMPGLFSPKATQWEATLFLGAAMAITAFPMLARIIYERGLSGTPLGTLALAAGAIDDAAAWCVLAVVLASFGKGAYLAYWAIGGGVSYALFMLLIGRRLLAPLGRSVEKAGTLTPTHLAILLTLFARGVWWIPARGCFAARNPHSGIAAAGGAVRRRLFVAHVLHLLWAAHPTRYGQLLGNAGGGLGRIGRLSFGQGRRLLGCGPSQW